MTYIDIVKLGLYGQIGTGNNPAIWILFMVLTAGIAYLIGSLCPSILIANNHKNIEFHLDIDGYATLTNLYEICGKKSAIIAFLLELFSGFISTVIGVFFVGYIGGYFAGIFVILGNALPIFHHFKGGKGVIVLLGSMAVMHTTAFIVMFGLMVFLYYVSKYPALGSIICVAVMPLMINTWGCVQGFIIGFGNSSLISGLCTLFGFVSMFLVLYYYKKNIKRMWKNQEQKIEFFKGTK